MLCLLDYGICKTESSFLELQDSLQSRLPKFM